MVAIVTNSFGCVSCQLLRSLEDPAQLAIIEAWESVAARQDAAQMIPPEMLAAARAMFAAPPVGIYYQKQGT